jgi:hypothetical protein
MCQMEVRMIFNGLTTGKKWRQNIQKTWTRKQLQD